MFIDTHAHIDYFKNPKRVVQESLAQGVGKIILPGVEPDKFDTIISLIEQYDCVYGGIGVHPNDAHLFNKEAAKKMTELSEHPKIVAIGEIGLDYHHNPESAELQKEVFATQLEIASAQRLPLMIHDRDAHDDVLEILKKYEVKNAIMHCFSGNIKLARECVKMGMLLGIGGVVTFKNAKDLKTVVKEIPLESIVLETDAPYLAPHPFRGEENSPKYLNFIAKEIANLKDTSVEEVEDVTTQNALKFFNLKKQVS